MRNRSASSRTFATFAGFGMPSPRSRGKGRKLTNQELEALIDKLGFEPTLQTLNR